MLNSNLLLVPLSRYQRWNSRATYTRMHKHKKTTRQV